MQSRDHGRFSGSGSTGTVSSRAWTEKGRVYQAEGASQGKGKETRRWVSCIYLEPKLPWGAEGAVQPRETPEGCRHHVPCPEFASREMKGEGWLQA